MDETDNRAGRDGQHATRFVSRFGGTRAEQKGLSDHYVVGVGAREIEELLVALVVRELLAERAEGEVESESKCVPAKRPPRRGQPRWSRWTQVSVRKALGDGPGVRTPSAQRGSPSRYPASRETPVKPQGSLPTPRGRRRQPSHPTKEQFRESALVCVAAGK